MIVACRCGANIKLLNRLIAEVNSGKNCIKGNVKSLSKRVINVYYLDFDNSNKLCRTVSQKHSVATIQVRYLR